MHRAILVVVFALPIVFTNGGCKKELSADLQTHTANSGGQETKDRDGNVVTVLGPKHTIPYKVDVIKQAYNNLYEPDISTLLPNYLYVRFLPQNPQDVKKLLESGISLWDIPLDNEIISLGESYHDPSLTDSTLTWQYAVVEVNTPLPSVQYEVLEQLALVSEDCTIAQEAFKLTGNDYEIPDSFEPNPNIVNGKFDFHLDHESPTASAGGERIGDCDCPLPDNVRKPSGCVQYFDNMFHGYQGVINVEVHTSKSHLFGFIFYRKTETDHNGCWEINHNYRGKLHVWVRWENSTCNIKTMNTNVDLWGYTFPRRQYIGKFNGPNFNNLPIKFDFTNNIGSVGFHNWVASAVNNAVFYFKLYPGSVGITSNVPDNLKILISPWDDANTGAAPMLDKMGIIQQFILYQSTNTILRGILGVVHPTTIILALPLATWLEAAAPDISLNLNNPNNVNSDDITELINHELAHALHFNQVGSNYWLDNIVYTVQHSGYGDGSAPGAGRCSVIESWGFQVGMISTHNMYGAMNSNPGNPAANTWRARLESERGWIDTISVVHIPFGWEWDIQDDNSTNPANEVENGVVAHNGGDRVFGITQAEIFGTMTSNMQSIPQMKTALAPFLPSSVSITAYNILCSTYGF